MKAILKQGRLAHLSPPGAGVRGQECASSVELGKSHSQADRCLTLSDSRLHLRCRSAGPLDAPVHEGYLCTHVCVQDVFVSKTRRGGNRSLMQRSDKKSHGRRAAIMDAAGLQLWDAVRIQYD